jgi:hypothetical protein
MVNHGVVALGLASATLVSSIITIATPVVSTTLFGTTVPSDSGAAVGGPYSGLTVTSLVLALGMVGAAAHAHVKKHSQSWLAAAALTFLVFVFELAAFAKMASDVSQINKFYSRQTTLSFSASFAFAIITWLLSMPTMAFCFLASKAPAQAPAQAQAPAMAQAAPVKTDAPLPQGITSV